MNRKRIIAIAKLVLLFGTPLALLLGLFSCGVYCGVSNRGGITRFERDWLGLDVQVPDEPAADPPEAAADDGADEPSAPSPQTKTPTPTPVGETPVAETPSPTTTPAPTPTPAPTTPPAAVVPGPSPSAGVPAPLPPPQTRVDPLDEASSARRAEAVVVPIRVLVDASVIEGRSDWIDYVQRTVGRASHIYEQQFGIRLQLAGVGQWVVAPEGMDSAALLADLRARPREGASVVVGFTARPFDGSTSGTADTPTADSPFNGASGVVYATVGHREPHLRTLLHELAHLFGARDIIDPEHPAWKAGSWMSYAQVPENQAPWIDRDNVQRVLGRKDLPFAPAGTDPQPQTRDEDLP